MSKVLGRVTSSGGYPRGPDALHRVRVPRDWLDDGATIELELPRNLACAGCEGGGCDICGRAGAITLRGRNEPPELVEVTLPARRKGEEPPSSGHRGLVLRIPDQGGLPEPGLELPRGVLMLRVVAADEADPAVRRVVLTERAAPVVRQVRRAQPPSVRIVAVLVILWILLLIALRLGGWV